uniref:Uncharacterized protein n=1 Tax=Chromera velia CCMP2878 TaxID=1169474 RepID=A0A0G4HBC5_9ALVE|eukprot:Cvel_919.t1-p1 / transcript=Cvel_919.t1 / gene=Cvel_919 / organism=Chromera_velia_CCMP2878 / gene_product=hypothetical protein / transcript_product=hypothetical protein / location=Cvel_scaffold29:69050-69754(+) / protein_length=235 / sequence_SO=supercontig / SO=protein_coding / is_pseudo=false
MDKCRAMAGKTNCNSFATVSHLEPNPAAAVAIRVTGEFKSANYVGGTGNPPLNHGGRGGRGGNAGKGKGGGFHGGYQTASGSFNINSNFNPQSENNKQQQQNECPGYARQGGHDEGYDCRGLKHWCAHCESVGHFERACPDIRRKHAERGRARGRGGRPPARGGTQVRGQGPAPHVASYMCNYSAGPPVPPGYSAMMTAPSFPFMKALGDVENPTFRVGEVLGKAEEGTGSGDSW